MFTGLVQGMGTITALSPKPGGYFLKIKAGDIASSASLGDSISISGVCLSVVFKEKDELTFEVMAETVEKTTLSQKRNGEQINLEAALRVGDRLGGHFVFGHVDGVGSVTRAELVGDNLSLTIVPPLELTRYFVPQGSVSIDGVSLTVARLTDEDFTVALIGDTIKRTTLGRLQTGARVNIEVDMLAKYVERAIKIT